jgi:hypothetical protein
MRRTPAAIKTSTTKPTREHQSRRAGPGFNDAESPLAWLRARRGPAGNPLISDEQFQAGERLRADFERAMLTRRTTTNWDLAGAGRCGAGTATDLSDAALAAGERYHRALESVGPELAGILSEVCCLAAGLEQAERRLNLPQRSGKAVLGLALTALARHYGLIDERLARDSGVLRWGLAGYRPAIPPAAGPGEA